MTAEERDDDLDIAATAIGAELFAELEILEEEALPPAIRSGVLAVAAAGRTTVDEAAFALLTVLLDWIRDASQPVTDAMAAGIFELARHGGTASRGALLAELKARHASLHLDPFLEQLALARADVRTTTPIIPINASAPFWVTVVAAGRTVATAGSPLIRGNTGGLRTAGSTRVPVQTRLGDVLGLVVANQTGESLHVRIFGATDDGLRHLAQGELEEPLPDGEQRRIDYVASEASMLVIAGWSSTPPGGISTFSELTASEPRAVRTIELTVE